MVTTSIVIVSRERLGMLKLLGPRQPYLIKELPQKSCRIAAELLSLVAIQPWRARICL